VGQDEGGYVVRILVKILLRVLGVLGAVLGLVLFVLCGPPHLLTTGALAFARWCVGNTEKQEEGPDIPPIAADVFAPQDWCEFGKLGLALLQRELFLRRADCPCEIEVIETRPNIEKMEVVVRVRSMYSYEGAEDMMTAYQRGGNFRLAGKVRTEMADRQVKLLSKQQQIG